MEKIKIKNAELMETIVGNTRVFPKYTTQIINLANQNSQGTRPTVVGQLSEMIQECPYKTYEEWKRWYLEQKPNALDDSFEKVSPMIEKLREAIDNINEDLIREWIEDLVIDKTFVGLKFQEAILKRLSLIKRETYRLSTAQEESEGIDGYIGNKPISIKPVTYKTKNMLRENINVTIVYYDKKKDGINVEYEF